MYKVKSCVIYYFSVFRAHRLHMVTWNVATADPPADVTSLLHLNSPKSPDLYVVGSVLLRLFGLFNWM